MRCCVDIRIFLEMSSTCLILNGHGLCEKGGCIASISMVKLGQHRNLRNKFMRFKGGEQRNFRNVQ